MTSSVSEYLTVQQLARRWGVGSRIVLAHIHSGRLPAVNVSAGSRRATWRLPRAAVLEFESARQPIPAQRRRRRRHKAPEITRFFGTW